MGRAKPKSRQRARLLRSEGWPLRRIANEVGAALSTVSVWVRDVESPHGASRVLPVTVVTSHHGELRSCGRCHRDLPLTSFNRHPSGHQWWCRDCYRAYFRARSERHRHQVEAARRDRRKKARAFVADYLRVQSCTDCGEADPLVLEFHHLQEKKGNVADMVRAGSSIRLLRRELGNCRVLCANCHRTRTAESRGSWRLEPVTLDSCCHLSLGERRNLVYIRDLLLASQCVECGDSRLVVLEFRPHRSEDDKRDRARTPGLQPQAASGRDCPLRGSMRELSPPPDHGSAGSVMKANSAWHRQRLGRVDPERIRSSDHRGGPP
jgi:hypothetical protein